jgi:hypothetical protein
VKSVTWVVVVTTDKVDDGAKLEHPVTNIAAANTVINVITIRQTIFQKGRATGVFMV